MFEAFKWTTALLSIVGVVANIHHKRWCFYVWAFTNASWVAIDLYHGVWAQAALMSVYLGLAIYGLIKWSNIHAVIEKQ